MRVLDFCTPARTCASRVSYHVGAVSASNYYVILTEVYILTVVSSLSDCSPQHSPHTCFHVIFISAYSAVRVKI